MPTPVPISSAQQAPPPAFAIPAHHYQQRHQQYQYQKINHDNDDDDDDDDDDDEDDEDDDSNDDNNEKPRVMFYVLCSMFSMRGVFMLQLSETIGLIDTLSNPTQIFLLAYVRYYLMQWQSLLLYTIIFIDHSINIYIRHLYTTYSPV